MMKRLPASRSVLINNSLVETLTREYGTENVKVVEKSIEKQSKMH